jgi:hypothetical protein
VNDFIVPGLRTAESHPRVLVLAMFAEFGGSSKYVKAEGHEYSRLLLFIASLLCSLLPCLKSMYKTNYSLRSDLTFVQPATDIAEKPKAEGSREGKPCVNGCLGLCHSTGLVAYD